MIDILKDLKERELIYQTTNLEGLQKRLSKGKIVLYCGFDPTGESLHLGNFLHLIALKRFQMLGHQPIVVLGGATGLIGDPSGRIEERPLISRKILEENKLKIKKQIEKFLDFKGKNKALILDNYLWHSKQKLLNFLREIGKNFTVSYLLAKESVKNRLETGISFTEFSYNLLQAFDFYYLFKNYNCELQIGGSDQWGNITSGIDLIKKIENKEAFGLTLPLITTTTGEKFGKSTGKGIWISKNLTSPYELYQFLFNTPDSEVIKLLKYFTFLSLSQIEKLEKELKNQPEKREAQRVLAFEMVKIIHSEKEAKEAEKISKALFYGNIKDLTEKELEIATKDLPTFVLENTLKISLLDLLVLAKISLSKREARQDILNGIIFINDIKYDKLNSEIKKSLCLFKKYLIIRKGKKNYYLVLWK